MPGLVASLKTGAKKAAVNAAVSAGIALAMGEGGVSVNLLGANVPKWVASGVVMGASSYATDLILPRVVPWVVGSNPNLENFELLVLQPLIAGATSVAVDSLAAPGNLSGSGGVAKALVAGAGSQIATYYVFAQMGWAQY